MRGGAVVIAVALLALCAAPLHTAGQDAEATVTTTFNLYGNSVEPFDDSKQSALKTAVAQSAGHGVTADHVQVSVDATYADQQKSGRRLLQDNSNLVQPGVRVTSKVQTTQQLSTSVSQSIDNALQNNQIAQVFSANGGQADYTTIVTASNTGSSGSSPSGTSPSDSNNGHNSPSTNSSPDSGSTNSSPSSGGGGGGSSFPTWVIALIVILVLLVVGLGVGCLCWRRRTKRREIQAQEFQAATYFSNSDNLHINCSGIGAKVSDTWGGIKEGTTGFFSRFRKAPLPIVATTSPAPANPSTPFSTVGFRGSPTPGITRTNSGGNMSGDKYGGFVTRAPTTPKGSSIPSPGAYQAAPKVSSPGLYTPKRAGRLESLKDINDI